MVQGTGGGDPEKGDLREGEELDRGAREGLHGDVACHGEKGVDADDGRGYDRISEGQRLEGEQGERDPSAPGSECDVDPEEAFHYEVDAVDQAGGPRGVEDLEHGELEGEDLVHEVPFWLQAVRE